MKGFGGCPMAADDLTGNMPTENMFFYFNEQKLQTGLNNTEFLTALQLANQVFENAH
jgi:hydroxymethylglutaryl-CoA lyase